MIQTLGLFVRGTNWESLYLGQVTSRYPPVSHVCKASFKWRKVVSYSSHPERANVSYIHLQNVANRLHKKQNVDSATRVKRLDRSPFFDGRVTLLAGPTFLHMNTLARPAGSTWSRRHNQSIRIAVLDNQSMRAYY